MEHTWDYYDCQARMLRRLGATEKLAWSAVSRPPAVPKLAGVLLRGAHQRAVRRAVALLPRQLQAQLPRITLTARPLVPNWDAWYSSDTGVISLVTSAEPFQRALRGDALQLAAVIVHELEHHVHPEVGEASAYDAEIAFLRSRQASPRVLAWAEEAKARATSHPEFTLRTNVHASEQETDMYPNPSCSCPKCKSHFKTANAKADEFEKRLTAEIAALRTRDYTPPDPYAAGIKALQEAYR
jgi:hypothetical protein